MLTKISTTNQVTDNILEIIPSVQLEDNSEYIIKIEYISNKTGTKTLENVSLSFCSSFSPCYCSLQLTKSLISQMDISDKDILYHLREASKFADYLITTSLSFDINAAQNSNIPPIDPSNVPFVVQQFVKYKAAYDCVLETYMNKAVNNNTKGSLGDVTFENNTGIVDISKLLKILGDEVIKWQDAVRGFGIEGRTKPVSAVRSVTPMPVIESKLGPSILPLHLDYNRGV